MKTVLVTGAAGGIGRAIVAEFAKKGYHVILHCFRSTEAAKTLCSTLRESGVDSAVVRADIGDPHQVNAMITGITRTFGGVDILVNNAGIARQRLFTDITDEEWEEMLSVNLSGVFYTCRAVLPGMLKKQSGSIVNIASVWGQTGGSCEVHYSAAKAGVIGLTKALAKEVGPSGIRVNCVAPGVISTPMNASLSVEDLSRLSEETPLRRIGEPDEVARAVLYLAEDSASFVTGQVLSVGGGYYI